jgi:multidrug transporter EmrE-like cation transporter
MSILGIGDVLRGLGVPSSWSFILASVGAMIGLAALDFVGAVFAKEWADNRQPLWFVAGLIAFGLLFVLYAGSLRFAELSTVTLGWIVFLQVGILLYERLRFAVDLSPDKWFTIAAILVLQVYLVLAPGSGPAGR